MPTFDKPEDAENALTTLFLRAVPEDKKGLKTLTELARIVGVSRWAMHKWLKAEKLAPHWAVKITEISKIAGYDDSGEPILGEPRVQREEFDQFVYKG